MSFADESARRARRRAVQQRRHSVARLKPWTPRDVPELFTWWDVGAASGLGTAAFKIPDGNGHTTCDQIQATTSSQPSLLTENGVAIYRMAKVASGAPSILSTAGSITAGWTGATYIAGWFRLPDASGDETGTNLLFRHSATASGTRRIAASAAGGAPDSQGLVTSTDGASNISAFWTNNFIGGAMHWCEFMFDPLFTLGGSLGIERAKLFIDFVAATRTGATPTVATSIFDGSNPITIASGTGAGNADTTDWCFACYGNGLPSIDNRYRSANYRNPTGALLTP